MCIVAGRLTPQEFSVASLAFVVAIMFAPLPETNPSLQPTCYTTKNQNGTSDQAWRKIDPPFTMTGAYGKYPC